MIFTLEPLSGLGNLSLIIISILLSSKLELRSLASEQHRLYER